MAYFLLVADHPKWPLFLVASYLNQDSAYVSFDLRRAKPKKYALAKNMFMLSWHISEKRLMPSSEWRQLQKHDAVLADWALAKIEEFMTEGKIDVEIESGLDQRVAEAVAG